MPQTFNRKNEISDVVKWEVDPIFCRDYLEVNNTAGLTDIEFLVGECYDKKTGNKLEFQTEEVPAAWTVTMSNGWAEGDTLTIAGTTFTFKASEADATQNELNIGTAAQVVAQIANIGLTAAGFDVVYGVNGIVFTQSTPSSSGSAPLATTTSTTATVEVTLSVEYSTGSAVSNDIDLFIVLENKKVFAGSQSTVLGICRGPAIVDIKNVICADKEEVETQLGAKNIITIKPSPQTVYQFT